MTSHLRVRGRQLDQLVKIATDLMTEWAPVSLIKNANFTEQNLLISILDRSLFFSINETEKVFKLIVERLVWNRGTNLQFMTLRISFNTNMICCSPTTAMYGHISLLVRPSMRPFPHRIATLMLFLCLFKTLKLVHNLYPGRMRNRHRHRQQTETETEIETESYLALVIHRKLWISKNRSQIRNNHPLIWKNRSMISNVRHYSNFV